MRYPVRKAESGFTLLELLVVISIIMILVAGIVKVGRNVRVKAQIRSTQSVIQIFCDALQEYQNYKHKTDENFRFPPEPMDFTDGALKEEMIRYNGVIEVGQHEQFTWEDGDLLSADEQEKRLFARASIELIYFCLSEVPSCQTVLNKLPRSAIVNSDNTAVIINENTDFEQQKPLYEVIDEWGNPIRYQTTPAEGNFPTLTSSGPDGKFDTADDIVSSKP